MDHLEHAIALVSRARQLRARIDSGKVEEAKAHALIAIAEQLERINPSQTFMVGQDGKSYCTHCGKEDK